MVGGEGAGKISNTNTVVVRMVCAKKVKRVSVISPALSINSPKTDWDWLSHVAEALSLRVHRSRRTVRRPSR
jgi:hypothetical protein